MTEMFKSYQLTDTIKLRNRIIMAPMTTWSSQEDGQVSNEELNYYKKRSRGVGLVITATTYTMPDGMGFVNQFYAGDDSYIPSLTRLAKAIHHGGAKAVLQIFHAGRMSSQSIIGGNQIISASAIKALREEAELPRAVSEGEIHNILDSFYETTRRAIIAGFDGVEIHGANSYLIQQFFSPHSNRRDDYWGGSLEKRMRFPIGVIGSVKRAVADFANEDFIIGYRLSPEEKEEPGITIEATKEFVDILADQGLTYLNISLSNYNQTSSRNKEDPIPVGKQIMAIVNNRIPIMGVGSIKDELDVREALMFGYDMVQLGKALIMNPDWVEKVKDNKPLRNKIKASEAKSLHIPEGLFARLENFGDDFKIIDE